MLPAGPSVVDILANAAFYFGVVRMLAESERPVWTQMSFSAAEENFHDGARYGTDARVYWPGLGTLPATELVLRRLLPLAYEGLDRWGVSPQERDRLLGVVEQRCLTGVNGAAWQAQALHAVDEQAAVDRYEALRITLSHYIEHMHSNLPVHEWPAL